MATTSFGRATPVRSVAYKSEASQRTASDIFEWEFSDAMRSSRLPAGWFLLPSAAISVLTLIAVLH
jgi:hypothetical protein